MYKQYKQFCWQSILLEEQLSSQRIAALAEGPQQEQEGQLVPAAPSRARRASPGDQDRFCCGGSDAGSHGARLLTFLIPASDRITLTTAYFYPVQGDLIDHNVTLQIFMKYSHQVEPPICKGLNLTKV